MSKHGSAAVAVGRSAFVARIKNNLGVKDMDRECYKQTDLQTVQPAEAYDGNFSDKEAPTSENPVFRNESAENAGDIAWSNQHYDPPYG